jgi:hypothetical protein
MTQFLRAAVRREVGPALRLSLWGLPVTDRARGSKLGAIALARAWLVRLSRRGTLAAYRARHRPLAGPPPGARLPQ